MNLIIWVCNLKGRCISSNKEHKRFAAFYVVLAKRAT